ncbi:MAG: ATP-binding protein [Bacteroidales bacterium]|jgi:AAA+ superfamily predicted ATPase|nr:ATP-binding protein [Bacteroidales bacterium]
MVDKKEMARATQQRKYDMFLFAAYTANKEEHVEKPEIEDMLYKRANEIYDKVAGIVIELLNSDKVNLPELERMEPEPTCSPCLDYPSRIFNYTDKLTLLNEGYVMLDDIDKDCLEERLVRLIESAFMSLLGIEKDILNLSTELREGKEGKPWYEAELLDYLLAGVDYDETMRKVDEHNEEGLWYEGYQLMEEDLEDYVQGGFSDVAGMDELKEQIQSDFIDVLKEPERAKKLGINIPNGMLLYGPPGCGKTLLGTKIAEETKCYFKYVRGSDLGSIYIHGSQLMIAEMFNDARKNAPSILFLDEVEVIIPKRSEMQHEHNKEETAEFLTQLNHCGRTGVFVIAATNHPEDIDEAALRSGRLDMKVYMPPPNSETRAILFIHALKDKDIHGKVDIDKLVEKTEGYVSADIKKIVELTARRAFREKIDYITMEMLEQVLAEFKPTVSMADIKKHETIRDRFEGRKTERNPIGFR